MTAERAREDESSHRAQGVLPRECGSWLSYLQMSMNPCGGRKRISKKMIPMIQGQLQFEGVALLLATY